MVRYAVRLPGQMGERHSHDIVSTNNVEAPEGYCDENVREPTHAMNQHGNSCQHPTHFGLRISGMRFCTFMGMMKEHFGQVTPEMAQDRRKNLNPARTPSGGCILSACLAPSPAAPPL